MENEMQACDMPTQKGIIELTTDGCRKILDRQQMLNEQLFTLQKRLGIQEDTEKAGMNAEEAPKSEGQLGHMNEILRELEYTQDRTERLIRLLNKL